MQWERGFEHSIKAGFDRVEHHSEVKSAKGGSKRPILDAMLASLTRGDMVIVYSLTRIGRSTRHLFELVEDLQRRGVDLVSITEALDTTTPTGKLMFGILAVMAQFERELLGERTKAGLAHLRDTGRKYCGDVYGWRATGGRLVNGKMVDQVLEFEPKEQAVMTAIRIWRNEGRAYAFIADTLNRQHVPTKSGTTWHASTVRGILQRTTPPSDPSSLS
jgi:DNA invertase Pin-like site-specific DNA recombinase